MWIFLLLSFVFPPIKSEKFECSWNRHRDVPKVGTPLSVSIHCQRTLWVQANSHNHCLLIRQHCQRALFGRAAWMPHCQSISVLHLWEHNWKNRLPEAEAWRRCCCCSPGARGCRNCLECSCWNPSTAGEGRRRRNPQACSLPQQSQCRTSGAQTWAPRYLSAFACLKSPAAFLQSKGQGVLNAFLDTCSTYLSCDHLTCPLFFLSACYQTLIPGTAFQLQHWILSSQSALLIFHTPDFSLVESSIHYPQLSHQILPPALWAHQTSPNLSVQPWTSSGSAQLNYPSDHTSNPKWVRKQINYPSANMLHFHVQPSCTDHFLQFKLPKTTGTGCFHSLFLFPPRSFSVFFSSSHIKKHLC